MEKIKINWDMMQLYMKISGIKKSFEKAKNEYEEFILKCEKNIMECDEILKEITKRYEISKSDHKIPSNKKG